MGFLGFDHNSAKKTGEAEKKDKEPKLTWHEQKTQRLISDFTHAKYTENYRQVSKLGSKLASRSQGALVLEAIRFFLSQDNVRAIDTAMALGKTLLREGDIASAGKAADLLEKFDPVYMMKNCLVKDEGPGYAQPQYSEKDVRYSANESVKSKVHDAGKSLRSAIEGRLKEKEFYEKYGPLLAELSTLHPN